MLPIMEAENGNKNQFPSQMVTSVEVGTSMLIKTGTTLDQEYTSIGQCDPFNI